MAVPAKPAGPYTLNANNALSAGAYVFPMTQAVTDESTAPAAVGLTNADAYYAVKGAVSLVTDSYGTGLQKPGGSPDNYIELSLPSVPRAYASAIPFTKVFVVKSTTTNLILYSSAIRNSGDFNYENNAQLILMGGGQIVLNSSNTKNVITTGMATPIAADEVVAVGMSWDGTTCRVSLNGTTVGSVANATSFSRTNIVGLGSGAQGDTQDGGTFYWHTHWSRALTEAELNSVTANPYQVVGSSEGQNFPPAFVSASTNSTGTQVLLNFNEDLATGGDITSTIAVSGRTVSSAVINGAIPTQIVATISPALTFGQSATATYTKPASGTVGIQDTAGAMTASFGPVAITNTVPDPSKPSLPGYKVLVFGDNAGDDFSTEAALQTYINGLDVIALGMPVMIYSRKRMVLTGRSIGPAASNDTLFVSMRPYPASRFSDIEADGAAVQYGAQGAEIAFESGEGGFRMGMDVQGFRVWIAPEASSAYQCLHFRRNGWGQTGTVLRFKHNRLLCESASPAIGSGEYGSDVDVTDNIFILNAANSATFWKATAGGTFHRNTWIRLGAAAGYPALQDPTAFDNNIFAGCGSAPVNNAVGANNYSDTSTGNAAITYVAGGVFTSSTNYRPKAGTAIIGGASASAISTPDNNMDNRGSSPDAGAVQLTPSTPLPQGTITRQEVDGASLIIEFSYTGTADSGLVSITPSGNGGAAQGPLVVTLNTVAQTGSIRIQNIVPGDYLGPTVTLTNGGGSAVATGATPFQINGASGLIYDPAVTAAATSLVWVQKPDSAIVGQTSSEFRVGLNGTFQGTVTVSISDGGASGALNPSVINIIDGASAGFVYTPSVAGSPSLTLTNTAGLGNPPPAALTVSQPSVPATRSIALPLTTDGTTPVAGMTGLKYAWFDQVTPDAFTAPLLKGNNGVISEGVFNLELAGTTLAADQTGCLLLTTSNGDPLQDPAALVFFGPVKVQ